MVAYNERNNRLEIVHLTEDAKRYIPCTGIDPVVDKVISVDTFGDEVRLRVAPRVGNRVGTGIVRVVTFNLKSAAGFGRAAELPPERSNNPFASRDTTPRR
jgi:hypothetical protein